ncbi:MAG TPA: beta-ketoacyl synthase N-terminal-like domain-containing protein, partial [Puia sp.]|nr:beta-ketoacyl synthase N-terminal-like domain-containing protein [Puia sp.]
MNVPSFVAGMGIVSAIGRDVQTNLDSLCRKRTGIGPMQWLSSARHQALPVGEVKFSNTELAAITGLSPKLPRTALLSCMAAKETLNNAGWKNDNTLRTGFISANTVGGMDKTENFYKLFSKNPAAGKLADVVHHECGAVTELVADFLGIQHFVSTVSTACSSSANSIFMGARMIGAGLLDCALVGGADALSRFTLNGFNTLMILDNELCKPFDENRRGLNLGEGAAYLLLCSEKALHTL